MKKSIIITIIVVVYISALLTMFFTRASELGIIYSKLGVHNDNFLHFIAFFVLAFLVRLMFTSKLYAVRHPLVWALVFSVVLAGVIELAQLFVPTRHAKLFDFGMHTTAVVAYIIVDYFTERWIKKHHYLNSNNKIP